MDPDLLMMLKNCLFECRKCSAIVTYDYHEKHLREVCPSVMTEVFHCNAPNCMMKHKKFESLDELINEHWKNECEGIVVPCSECQEPLYDLQDPEKFHECATAIAKGIQSRKKRLEELSKEQNELR